MAEQKEELYKGNLNEYTDWITGNNSITNTNETNNLKSSGGSIRNLLQDRLKKPFVMYEDIENNLYKMFSSNYTRDLYLSDKDTYADLMLFSFVRPNDYELTTNINPNVRYLIGGDDTQTSGILSYTWSVTKGSSQVTDSVTAIYTITDKDGNSQVFSHIYSSTQTSVVLNFYKYLKNGANTVSVVLKGTSTGAMTSASFPAILLTLDLSSDFQFNIKHTYGENLVIPYSLSRNVTSIATSILFYIDGIQVANGKIDIAADTAGQIVKGTKNIVNDLSEGMHVLQIWAEMEYNSATFRSNILYYTFETASSSSALNYFINVKGSFISVMPPVSQFHLTGTQYNAIKLEWGYYTDNLITDTSIAVAWKLKQGDTTVNLGTITANRGQQSSDLVFLPSIYSTDGSPINLVGYNGDTKLITIPITIAKSTLKMYETDGYVLKLQSYGKTNESVDRTVFNDTENNITTDFTGVTWDDTIGWYQNSLRLIGLDSYAVINAFPLANNPSNGRTIEVEFESEKVDNDTDIILQIGDNTGGHINITPNSATLYDSSNNLVIQTNFKSNERVKLAFIINEDSSTSDSNLAYIINNGVLERGAGCAGLIMENNTGKVTIGKSKSGIKFYSIRVYNRAISYTDAYNNWVFDSENKASIIADNNVIVNNALDYDLCVNKLDTILLQGDLSKILNATTDKDESLLGINMQRICPFDSTKNFTLTNGLIRKHGQSTLNYPITSMKFWTDKGLDNAVTSFSCPYQIPLLLSKNRYKMKDTSIPANKFVLQANYADSSGVQNGGLQRLIQNTWFNAVIDGEYKLRTPPQLFTTNQLIHHNNSTINEDGTIDGYGIDTKQWDDYFDKSFPYDIRVTPDNFPCVVFYQDTKGTNTKTFLGQYVFMEDKKSDYCYGERSIYKADANDPFCLTTVNKGKDTEDNKIWDNNKVLRIEVLQVNSPFSSYLSNANFTDIVYSDSGVPISYKWENDFEMIYPDPDDLTGDPAKGTDKFGAESKFAEKAKPFIDWFNWVVSTKGNQSKFEAEAAQHLDLYKMAAYYIYCLRFGLVDSAERNAQIKTYDGIHFHYEPWDMDIGIGKKNTGGIAFQPPIDRTTTLPGDASTYAFSGRNGLVGSKNYTSNWLLDALEAWHEWIDIIVPTVAQALYTAGLSYDTSKTMFDENYMDKWCEVMYNESGYFKYIISAKGSNAWLAWLQGSAATYRHWWLSVSMDYYDAKWSCGDFKNHYIYAAIDHVAKTTAGTDIVTVVPNIKTYFNISRNYIESLSTIYATPENPAHYDASLEAFATKAPFTIYGASYIESLDLSCFATGLDTLTLGGAYSNVLGASIKDLNIGTAITKVDDEHYTGLVSGRSGLSIAAETPDGNDALAILQNLNIRGQQPYTDASEFYSKNRIELKNVYAMGSGLATFYSSKSGNRFDTLELPGITTDINGNVTHQLASIYLVDSCWNTMTFWDTAIGKNNVSTFTKCHIGTDYTLNIPRSIKSVTMLGTSCSNSNSLDFVLNWIACIKANGDNIGDAKLKLSGINWSDGSGRLLTYDELADLAKFNGGVNNTPTSDGTYNLSGYIVLNTNGVELTAQQLSQIKSWFGDTVFSKNSAGLVIDHKMDYIQINVGSNATIKNNEVYLQEGNHASLNATKFALGESDANTYNWFIRQPGSDDTGQTYKKTYLSKGDDGIMYLYADESSYGNYDVEIVCTSNESSLHSTAIIHIISSTYPTDYNFNSSNTNLRTCQDAYVFYKASVASEFYITPVGDYNATIKSVVFSITSDSGSTLLQDTNASEFSTGAQSSVNVDDYLAYTKNATHANSLPLYAIAVDSAELHKYIITAKVTFLSGKVMTASTNVIIIDDKTAIIANDGSLIYQIINQKYASQHSGATANSYYKSDLMSLTGVLDFTTDPMTGLAKPEWLNITSIKTQDNRSVLKYLPNISQLTLSGTAITSTNNNINYAGDTNEQLVFDKMTSLGIVVLQNCAALTDDIDFSNTPSLRVIVMQGTTINAILAENTDITQIMLGTPTKISLISPKTLSHYTVQVDNASNLDSLEITNMPNIDTFATFGKIFNL